ncbi:cytidine deaminase [Candidatus Gastranaerophilus sp. (ex Termes propinquus)]|nr:cytidine deaminase [Candidatus Gastranaerophilus sp. (ex Termes propinquus)]
MQDMYKDLMALARKASENAYAPYSGFSVGACVLFDSGNRYTGVNVENASLGLSICAERSAIACAVSQGEKGKLRAVAIFASKQKECLPCGACRQWVSEFDSGVVEIIVEGKDSEIVVYKMSELLPNSFKYEQS